MYPAARAELRNVLKVRAARELGFVSGSLDGPASEARRRVTVAERRAAVKQKPGKAMAARYCGPLEEPLGRSSNSGTVGAGE